MNIIEYHCRAWNGNARNGSQRCSRCRRLERNPSRSESQLMEQIHFDRLCRWFLGFCSNDPVWDHSTFTKNRHRLLNGDVARRCFAHVPGLANRAGLQPPGTDLRAAQRDGRLGVDGLNGNQEAAVRGGSLAYDR